MAKERDVQERDVRIILNCSTCPIFIKAFSVNQVLEIARKDGWYVNEAGQVLCEDCVREEKEEEERLAEAEELHRRAETNRMSNEQAGR